MCNLFLLTHAFHSFFSFFPGVDGVQALLYRNGTNLIYNPPMKQKKQKKDKNKSNSNSTIPTQQHPSTTLSPPIVTKLPKWIDWERVIEIGEKLGRNKDMFRTDIFVGVTASSSSSSSATSASTKSYDNHNKSNIIRYVVSETEIHPTPLRGYEIIFNEAGRLWLAGYYYYYYYNNADINNANANANANINDDAQQQQQQQKTNKFNIKVIQNNEVPYGFYQ